MQLILLLLTDGPSNSENHNQLRKPNQLQESLHFQKSRLCSLIFARRLRRLGNFGVYSQAVEHFAGTNRLRQRRPEHAVEVPGLQLIPTRQSDDKVSWSNIERMVKAKQCTSSMVPMATLSTIVDLRPDNEIAVVTEVSSLYP